MKGLSLRQHKRYRAAERAGYRCEYCGAAAPFRKDHLGNLGTLDHFIPRCLGGTRSFENSVWACRPCNAIKGDKLWPLEKGPVRLASVSWIRRKIDEELWGVAFESPQHSQEAGLFFEPNRTLCLY